MTRDYCGEMRQVIDAATADGRPYISRVLAGEIVAQLRIEDPELLLGWLDVTAEHWVWRLINDRDRALRSAALYHSPRSEFQRAAQAYATGGDDTALRRFLDIPFVVEDGTRKRLGTLDRDNLLFVATEYDKRANNSLMMSAFMKALAKKLQNGQVVSDVFNEEQLAAIFDSLRK
jgi:hypothetical protein